MRNPTNTLLGNGALFEVQAAAPSRSATIKRYGDICLAMAASDGLVVCLALTLAYWVRHGVGALPPAELVLIGTAPLVWVLVFQAFRLYSPLHLSAAEEFRRTIGATGTGMVLLVMVSFWTKSSYSRVWVALTWALVLAFELLTRWALRLYLYRRKLDGRLTLRTLIIGSTGEAVLLAQALSTPGSGFLPLGYVQPPGCLESEDTLPVLGGTERLRDLIGEQSVDCLFVASTLVRPDVVELVAHAARQEGIHVLISAANMTHVLSSRLSLQQIGSVTALSLRPVRLTGKQAVAKRAFDLLVGSTLLLATLPIWLAAGIVVRLTSPGPVFFYQERVTKGGRTFRMYKFRTMRQGLESSLDTTAPFFKLDHDPRVTPVGHLLRKWSLDELPQLWNVIRGEMSLVGPRPLITAQVASDLELLGPRHEVPAGMTGWWQTNGRNDVSPEAAVRLDTFYIENWSLAFDLYILLKTIATVIARKGAY